MPALDRRPMVPLALASLTIGALDHSSWFLAYAALLVLFSLLIGCKVHSALPLALILALGSPVFNVAAHFLVRYNPTVSWQQDAADRLLGAVIAIVPGFSLGRAIRFAWNRTRRPVLQSSNTL